MAIKVLFQGDSITDCQRHREPPQDLGTGYPLLVRASLDHDYPNEYEFVNRGISGNRIVDLYARIKSDFINIRPDIASIYIGVNDAWYEVNAHDGVDTDKFVKIYEMLLDEIYAACPNIKLFLLSPFVLEGALTENIEQIPDRLSRLRLDVAEKAAAVKKIAEKYHLPCIDLQAAFDKACEKAPSTYWTRDGLHPTPGGHEIIKKLWLEVFEKIK